MPEDSKAFGVRRHSSDSTVNQAEDIQTVDSRDNWKK